LSREIPEVAVSETGEQTELSQYWLGFDTVQAVLIVKSKEMKAIRS